MERSIKIDFVTVQDTETNTFLVYVEQYPGICAQADTADEALTKAQKYFDEFMDKLDYERLL